MIEWIILVLDKENTKIKEDRNLQLKYIQKIMKILINARKYWLEDKVKNK